LTIKTQWLKFNDKILKKQYVLRSLACSSGFTLCDII
jgi:hypothetical protein